MGWASYQEDIVSRWGKNNYSRARRFAAAKLSDCADNRDPSGGSTPKQEKQVSKLKDFTMSSARPLPVIVLADVSASMGTSGKIEALNDAVAEMISTFAEEDDSRAEIHVSVITFGLGGAAVHKPLRPANETQWEAMEAAGRTPMGKRSRSHADGRGSQHDPKQGLPPHANPPIRRSADG